MFKIAIVVSHPIQHFCPQYASFATNHDVSIKVFFGSALGFKKYYDKSFDKEISWNNLGLDAFDHVFLNGDKVIKTDKNLDALNLESELTLFVPDLVISYGYFQKLQQRCQKWARSNGIPVAFVSDSERRRRRKFLTELYKQVFLPARFKSIDYFLSVGDANEDYYKTYGVPDRKFIRMPFPIDVVSFERTYLNKSVARKKIREALNIDEDALVCTMVGKLETFKRQSDLIAAIGKLKGVGRKVVGLIIGTGPDEENLKHLSSLVQYHRIALAGFIPPEDLINYYAATDVYIHCSEKDAHSLAISEAAFMGCALLLSDKCGSYGPTDDLQIGRNGIVFETGNVEQLSLLISYLLSNPGVLDRFSRNSREIGAANQRLSHFTSLGALVERVKYDFNFTPGAQ